MKKLNLYIIFVIILGVFAFSSSINAQVDNLWIMDTIDDMEREEEIEEVTLISLDLYWSANSYIPFGYQGRTLPCYGDLVEMEADLKLSAGNIDSLQFSWFLDDVFQESDSGYGRDHFEFRVRRNKGQTHKVLVKIFNESRSFYVEKDIIIPITNPEVVIYRKDHGINSPVYLSSSKAFDVISGEEAKFLALPYFFNIDKLNGLEFSWNLGKKSVTESSFTANVFGLKIINKKVEDVLKEKLRLIITNKFWDRQTIQKYININIY